MEDGCRLAARQNPFVRVIRADLEGHRSRNKSQHDPRRFSTASCRRNVALSQPDNPCLLPGRMAKDVIRVVGARQHNLKNLTIEIPRDRLVVITGPSGSGKSSLAFDTLFAEGQRKYVESLSVYARQFLDQLEKPDVEQIEGLSPA